MTSILTDIAKAMASLPPYEHFVSWSMAPADAAWHIKGDRENFTVAHASFWKKAEPVLRKAEAEIAPTLLGPSRILDADNDRELRMRVAEALKAALHPLHA